MKILITATLGWALLAPPTSGQETIVIDPQIDQSRVSIPAWFNFFDTLWKQVAEPAKLFPEIKIVTGPPGPAGGSCTGYIFISNNLYPYDKTDFWDTYYKTLGHELGHVRYPCESQLKDPNFDEGLAESIRDEVYMRLNPISVCPPPIGHTEQCKTKKTRIWMADLYNNLPWRTGGGAANFYRNHVDVYTSPTSQIALFSNKTGGDFIKITHAINQALPKNRSQYLELMSTLANDIAGVSPKTFFQYGVTGYKDTYDGLAFGILPSAGSMPDDWNGPSPVNPNVLTTSCLNWRGGIATELNCKVTTTITDVFGKVWYSDTKTVFRNFPLPEIVYDDNLPPGHLPEGGYRVTATACMISGDTCEGNFSDIAFLLIYRRNDWVVKNTLLLVTNGPGFGNFSPQTMPTVTSGLAGVTREDLPGLSIFRNVTSDITVSDGQFTRTLTPDRNTGVIYLFRRKDNPILRSITNSASFKAGSATPGSIVTIWAWGTSHNDPCSSSTLPLPKESCGTNNKNAQGKTKIIFSQDGQNFEAPIFYTSFDQINVQTPWKLRPGTARVIVSLNGVQSDPLDVPVVSTDPGIFMIDPMKKVGAVIFATGNKAGQIVTPDNPARAGDLLAIYATGLGSVDHQPLDGSPATATPLSFSTNSITVTLGGLTLRPSFSGLAPQFVGLYQINFEVPANVAKGSLPLTVTGGGSISNEANITISN